MAQPSPMNGGDGKYSYTNNSSLQRDGASIVQTAMKEALFENLDIEKLLSVTNSTTFAIADLGCSVGPNTFTAMQNIIETVEDKYHHEQGNNSKKKKQLEFQVLFNDQITNDFNTLFASLPHPRPYFAAAVPGSFHGRLFPSSSVHIMYLSYALHWLSKSPEAWNAGRIHYVGASDAVVKAYADQFETDMEIFLRARGEEIVGGGMIVIVMNSLSVPEGGNEHETALSIMGFLFESIFKEMVEEGVVEQEKVDSFNFPLMFACLEDMRRLVQKNGCFEIVKMELGDLPLPAKEDGDIDFERFIVQFRAVSEGTYANHFGKEIIDQLFSRGIAQNHKCTHMWRSSRAKTTTITHLFAVLKRKY